MTSGPVPPPRGQAALPGLAPEPVTADGQRLLPGLAGLSGAQHAAAGLIARGGRTGASAPDMEPDTGTDTELSRVAGELLTMDPDGSRIGAAVRTALDMLLDGQHTGRYRWDQLCKTEKTHAGTLVEIGIQRGLALADGALLDYSIAGTDVDCKFSHRMGRWMIPPESAGQLALLVQASDADGTWSAGLLRVGRDTLREASNRDLKKTLSERGRAAIVWLFSRCELQENVLVRMAERDVAQVLAPRSGQQRVNELFRRAQRRRVTRTVVATVAKQDDYMKRVRAGGGARDQLRPEGIVIFGDYAGDQALAAALGLPRPGPGEFVSARLTSRPACPGGPGRTIRLEGTDWMLAAPSDPAEPAPRLPRGLRAGPPIAPPRPVWSDRGVTDRQLTRRAGRWTVDDQVASPWHYIGVEVPPGARALDVRVTYDRRAGVLDLGCLGPGGFRGWSGGARDRFVIGADDATPGYLPGEIEPGLWQVIVAPYRVPPDGLDWELTAGTVSRAGPRAGQAPDPPPATERPPRRTLPASRGRRWWAGDLHTHTVHSDGALTVAELARLASGNGLDFIAVTDHNTVSHHRELAAAGRRYGITLIPGQEVTTSQGHAGALGDIGWVDFREPAAKWLAATRDRGGLLSVNHPIAGPVSWMHAMPARPPLIEVWHWSWLDLSWTTPLSWWRAWDPAAIPVGGSDWHRPGADAPPGTPVTWVENGSNEPAGLLAAIGAGRVAISAGRDGPVLLRTDGELVAVDADGTVLAGPDGPLRRVRGDLARFPATPGCHRLLSAQGATLALTP